MRFKDENRTQRLLKDLNQNTHQKPQNQLKKCCPIKLDDKRNTKIQNQRHPEQKITGQTFRDTWPKTCTVGHTHKSQPPTQMIKTLQIKLEDRKPKRQQKRSLQLSYRTCSIVFKILSHSMDSQPN